MVEAHVWRRWRWMDVMILFQSILIGIFSYQFLPRLVFLLIFLLKCCCVYFKHAGYFWKQTQLSLRPLWRQDTHCSYCVFVFLSSVKVHIHPSLLCLCFRELSSFGFEHFDHDSSALFYIELALHFSSEKLQNPSLWFGCVLQLRLGFELSRPWL